MVHGAWVDLVWHAHAHCRSHNAYIDYETRGQSYEIQHDDFHNTDAPNKFLAYGALVGGPQADDTCAFSLVPHAPGLPSSVVRRTSWRLLAASAALPLAGWNRFRHTCGCPELTHAS